MNPTRAVRSQLVRIGAAPDGDIDLAEAALVLASMERPRAAIEPYRRHLAKLVAEVAAFAGAEEPGGPGLPAEALRQVLARRYGYIGAEDCAEEDAKLMRVIDRRRGLPVALGIIYIHAARALGWTIDGIGFPARFLVRLQVDSRRLILDPFAGGRVLAPEDMRALYKALAGNQAELTPAHYRALGNRDILVRLQNNVKSRLLGEKRLEETLAAIEAMLLFAPGEAALWRESGVINARLDKVEAAVAALEEYLRRDTGDDARYRASALLQELRSRLG